MDCNQATPRSSMSKTEATPRKSVTKANVRTPFKDIMEPQNPIQSPTFKAESTPRKSVSKGNFRTPFKSKYHTPSTSKRVQKWSPRYSWSGGRSFPRDRHINKNFSRFNKDLTKNWDLSKLTCTLDIDVLVRNICRMLEEMNTFLIKSIVNCLGKKQGIQLMRETKTVQDLGGLELPCNPRHKPNSAKPRRTKRTVGGVFIHLAKQKIPSDQWKEINRLSEKNKPKKIKKRASITPKNKRDSRLDSECDSGKILFGTFSNRDIEQEKEQTTKKNINQDLQRIDLDETRTEIPRKEIKNVNTSQDIKQTLGDRLYPKVCAQEPALASKITGMLLDGMDNKDLSNLVERPELLREAVNEALAVYKEAMEQEEVKREKLAQQLYNMIATKVSLNEQSLIGKITGMLLEMPEDLLKQVIDSPDALTQYINNSIWVLQEEKKMIGNYLYPLVKLHTTNAEKVTGMLLELDPIYLNSLAQDAYALKEKVEECLSLLEDNSGLVLNFVSPFKGKRPSKIRA